jgi:hypothetical protein
MHPGKFRLRIAIAICARRPNPSFPDNLEGQLEQVPNSHFSRLLGIASLRETRAIVGHL